MLVVLQNTIKTFIKNWEPILLLMVPIILLELLEVNPILYYILSSIFIIGVQLFFYVYLLQPDGFHKLKSPILTLKFVIFYVGFHLIFVIATRLLMGLTLLLYFVNDVNFIVKNQLYFFLSQLIPSLLITGYIMARFSVIFPMIIMVDKLSLKNIYNISKDTNSTWIIVSLLFWSPLITIYIIVDTGEVYAIIFSLLSLLLCCFYSCYYQYKKAP